MPRLIRFLLPVVVMIIGAACVVVGARNAFQVFRQDGTVFKGPGEKIVSLKKAGEYTLWIQNRATIDGVLISSATDLPPGSVVEIVREGTEERIPLAGEAGMTVSINGTERESLGTIQVPGPGTVRISISRLDAPRVFYIAESIQLKGLFGSIALGAVGLSLFLVGVVLGIYFLIRRAPAKLYNLQPPGAVST